ncbi:hypothetical protein L596_009220 [Steinernema carpocapsae]|uniref:Uncharacterized protein n=1 Tax=Steinernema carpocapsae TaxID=34508 RepID=A0A4V6A6I6_STECR|nr:hypothetical protein L596_009220 [Steinernema carpocapsae]
MEMASMKFTPLEFLDEVIEHVRALRDLAQLSGDLGSLAHEKLEKTFYCVLKIPGVFKENVSFLNENQVQEVLYKKRIDFTPCEPTLPPFGKYLSDSIVLADQLYSGGEPEERKPLSNGLEILKMALNAPRRTLEISNAPEREIVGNEDNLECVFPDLTSVFNRLVMSTESFSNTFYTALTLFANASRIYHLTLNHDQVCSQYFGGPRANPNFASPPMEFQRLILNLFYQPQFRILLINFQFLYWARTTFLDVLVWNWLTLEALSESVSRERKYVRVLGEPPNELLEKYAFQEIPNSSEFHRPIEEERSVRQFRLSHPSDPDRRIYITTYQQPPRFALFAFALLGENNLNPDQFFSVNFVVT